MQSKEEVKQKKLESIPEFIFLAHPYAGQTDAYVCLFALLSPIQWRSALRRRAGRCGFVSEARTAQVQEHERTVAALSRNEDLCHEVAQCPSSINALALAPVLTRIRRTRATLPQLEIVLVGTAAAGKSHLLEALCGIKFNHVGPGGCTTRPLQLNLVSDGTKKQPGSFSDRVLHARV
jgi:hypothetical protein